MLSTEKSPNDPREQPNFEDALAALEEIVHTLEEGQIGLAESLARYEEGVKLLKQCYQILERAERRIELLSGVGAGGDAITQPFDDAALSLEEKARARSQRRSRKVGTDQSASSTGESGESEMDGPRTLF
jgi:exodeoxyribonuclease VII small subunit